MREISKKWSDVVEKSLGSEDKIQKTFYGKLDDKDGFLALSNKKLLFVQEKGLLRKTYTLILDIPYEQVGKVVPEDRYRLEIIETGGSEHNFTSTLNTSVIEKDLKELMESKRA